MRAISLYLLLTAALAPAATISFTGSGTVNGLSIGESIDSGATVTDYQSGQLPVTVTSTSTSGFADPGNRRRHPDRHLGNRPGIQRPLQRQHARQ